MSKELVDRYTSVGPFCEIVETCRVVSVTAIGCDSHDSTCSGCGKVVAKGRSVVLAVCEECVADLGPYPWTLDRIGRIEMGRTEGFWDVCLSLPDENAVPIVLNSHGRDGVSHLDCEAATAIAELLRRAVRVVDRRGRS